MIHKHDKFHKGPKMLLRTLLCIKKLEFSVLNNLCFLCCNIGIYSAALLMSFLDTVPGKKSFCHDRFNFVINEEFQIFFS